MDRKEFWERYREDPAGTWKVLAREAKDPIVAVLYKSWAAAEQERLAPIDQAPPSENVELHRANELHLLADKGPTFLEKIKWAVSNILFLVSDIASFTLRSFSRLVTSFSILWVLIFGAVVEFNVFGIGPTLFMIAGILVSFSILFFSRLVRLHFAASHIIVAIWFALAAITSSVGTVVSHKYDSSTLQSGYLTRSGDVIWATTFDHEDINDLRIMPPRRFGDRFEWLNHKMYRLEHSFIVEETFLNGILARRKHNISFNYFLEPAPIESPYRLRFESVKNEEEALARRLMMVVRDIASGSSSRDRAEYTKRISGLTHPLFNVKIMNFDLSVDEATLEIFIDGRWYEARPLEQYPEQGPP